MGMRIGGPSNAWASQSQAVGAWQNNQKGVKDMLSALASGDLASAQKAFAGIATVSSGSASKSPLAQIGKALQNNDLASAQSLAQNMLKSRQPVAAAVQASPMAATSATSGVNVLA